MPVAVEVFPLRECLNNALGELLEDSDSEPLAR
jgi:hypothetical protein